MSAPCTIVLLHSFGSAGRSWAAVAERLAAPVVAPDLPGFGGAAPLPQPSVEAYAQWALARMDDVGEALLVGASMGGKVAMAAAARRPAGLRGLVLCAPSPPAGEPMTQDERARNLASWGDAQAAAESVRASTFAPPASARFDEAVEDWLRTDLSTWRWWWETGSREAIDVDAMRASTTVLAGADDDHLGPDVQRRETLPRLPGAHLRDVARSRHLLALDRPDAVAEAIAASL